MSSCLYEYISKNTTESLIIKFLRLFLFIPLSLFSFTNTEYSEFFAKNLTERKLDCCYQVLFEWELEDPAISQIKPLRAALKLAEGDLAQSFALFNESIDDLRFQGIPGDTIELLLELYKKALIYSDTDGMIQDINNKQNVIDYLFCKNQQPRGVKFKFWFGVAQILAGCVVAPFSKTTGAGLIFTGITTIADATSDSLNNMEEWEKNLNERQKINLRSFLKSQNSYNSTPESNNQPILA